MEAKELIELLQSMTPDEIRALQLELEILTDSDIEDIVRQESLSVDEVRGIARDEAEQAINDRDDP